MARSSRQHKKKTVLAFGVFATLHPGHLAFLAAARRHGDRLVVVITPDARVRKEKGYSPLLTTRERMRLVAALKGVDRVVSGDRTFRWSIIRRLRPDVVAVGYDQRMDHPEFLRQLEGMSSPPILVQLPPFHASRYRSSKFVASRPT